MQPVVTTNCTGKIGEGQKKVTTSSQQFPCQRLRNDRVTGNVYSDKPMRDAAGI